MLNKRSAPLVSRTLHLMAVMAGSVLASWSASAQILPPPTRDYGDAPSSYGTLAADDGPSHTVSPLIFMGLLPTAESDAVNASGDASDDIDDGVILPAFYQNQSASIQVAVFGAGSLQAWIDWNGDGDFSDAGEQVATNVQDGGAGDADGLLNGLITLEVVVPAITTTTLTFARFRWSGDSDLAPTGAASTGEVEDYSLTIAPTTIHECGTGSSLTGSGYAPAGTGVYRNEIWWFDWSCADSTFAPGDTVNKSWSLPGGYIVTAKITGITEPITAYATGSNPNDALDDLYAGVNPIALSNAAISLDPDFNIAWGASFNGEPFPVDLIVADAQNTELVDLTTVTSDGSNWLPIEATGVLAAAFPSIIQNSVIMGDASPLLGGGTLLSLSEGVSTVDVSVTADGFSSVAFGVFLPIDTGDAPISEGSGAHYADYAPDSFPLLPQVVGTGLIDLTDLLTVANMLPAATVHLGVVQPDGDGTVAPNADASADDLTGIDDEDGVTLSGIFPGATILIPVQVTGADGYLQAWVDWNGDGDFGDAGEQVATNAQDGIAGASERTDDSDTEADLITLSVSVPASLTVGDTHYVRFRWSTVAGLAISEPAADGEVEDYAFVVEAGTAELAAEKAINLFDPAASGDQYALPGEDVVYTIRVLNVGEVATDPDSVVLIDRLPDEIDFWNGDIDDGRADLFPGTDPVGFTDTDSGLNFSYAGDVGYSNQLSRPSDFTDCNYTPATGYDPAVTFICFNPKGTMSSGEPDPEFSVSFRARIR